jgi:hypothetical protein
MREIALHLLDIAENSVAAQAKAISIVISEDLQADQLLARIQDDGKGMDEATLARVFDPFYTSRTTRKVGLGIPLIKAAAEACNGYLTIQSMVGRGTCIEVAFQHSHIDRMPLGDLAGTLLTLIVAYPNIHWMIEYQRTDNRGTKIEPFLLDTRQILAELDDIPLTEPAVLKFLREYIDQGFSACKEYGLVAGFADENSLTGAALAVKNTAR